MIDHRNMNIVSQGAVRMIVAVSKSDIMAVCNAERDPLTNSRMLAALCCTHATSGWPLRAVRLLLTPH